MTNGNASLFGGVHLRRLHVARLLWALVALASTGLAQTYTSTSNTGNTVANAAGAVSVTWVSATQVSYTYSKNANTPGSPGYAYGVWLYRTSGNGGGEGTRIFDISTAGATSGSGTLTMAAGEWLYLGARVMRSDWAAPGSTLHDDKVYYQHSATDPNAVLAKKRFSIRIPGNDSDVTIKYRLLKTKDGVTTVVEEFVKVPGSGATIVTREVDDDGSTYSIASRIEGFVFDETGGQWFVQDGAIRDEPQRITPVNTTSLPPATDTTTPPFDVQPPAEVPKASTTAKSGGSVWRGGGTGQGATDALTNVVFREGIDKVTTRQDSQTKLLEKLEKTSSERKVEEDKVKAALDGAPSMQGAEQQRVESAFAADKSAVEAAVAGINAGRGVATVPGVPGGGSGTSVQVDLGVNFLTGNTSLSAMELNPVLSPFVGQGLKSLIAWFRAFVGWSAVLGLMAYTGHASRQATATVYQTNGQVEGSLQGAMNSHPVTAFGFVPVRLAILGVLAGLFLGAPAALVQVFSTEWDTVFSASVAAMNAAQGGSDSILIFGVANDYVPLVTLLTVMATYAAFEWALMPVQIVWLFLARFCRV